MFFNQLDILKNILKLKIFNLIKVNYMDYVKYYYFIK